MGKTTFTDGLYIKFQAAVLTQAPRPDEMNKETVEFWCNNQAELKRVLKDCLLQESLQETNTTLKLLTTADTDYSGRVCQDIYFDRMG